MGISKHNVNYQQILTSSFIDNDGIRFPNLKRSDGDRIGF